MPVFALGFAAALVLVAAAFFGAALVFVAVFFGAAAFFGAAVFVLVVVVFCAMRVLGHHHTRRHSERTLEAAGFFAGFSALGAAASFFWSFTVPEEPEHLSDCIPRPGRHNHDE